MLPDQSQFFQTIWYIIKTFYPIILYGLGITFLLSVVGTVGGFVLSISLTQARLVNIDRKRDKKANIFFKAATRSVANGYVTLFRGTPMIVQSMIIFYGISALKIFPWWTPLTAGLIIVTINTTAYISEVHLVVFKVFLLGKWKPAEVRINARINNEKIICAIKTHYQALVMSSLLTMLPFYQLWPVLLIYLRC